MSLDIPTPPTLTSPYPCWGRHDRMGHTSRIGWFERDPSSSGTLLYWRPALPADAEREATEEAREILPEAGPAFFGFTPMSAESCLAVLLASRPRIWRERLSLPLAEEVGAEANRDWDDMP